MENELRGYVRDDGRVGFRNTVLIMPLTGCLGEIARRIADRVPGCTCFAHVNGCDLEGSDFELFGVILEHFVTHPNVGGVLVLSMGCASALSLRLPEKAKQAGRLTRTINMQLCGGTNKTIEAGVAAAGEMAGELTAMPRRSVPFSALTIGTKCGASDKNSFQYCHPVVGRACDMLIDKGATVVLSEDHELLGGTEVLAERATNEKISDQIREMARQLKKSYLDRFGFDPEARALQTQTREEWINASLDHAAKAGSKPISGFFDVQEQVTGPGLVILNAPNTDLESVTSLAASGCNLTLFTTGRGTPVGSPAAITVKITATAKTFQRMEENIDLCVAGVTEGTETIDQAAERVVQKVIEAANGEQTKAEILKHCEVAIPIRGVTF